MSSNNNNFDFSGLKRVIRIGMKSRTLFITVVLLSIVSAGISTYRPFLTGEAIDRYILQKDLPGLMYQLLLIGVILILETVIMFFVVYFANVLAQRVIKYLRVKLFNKLIQFKLSYFDKTPNGVLVTRSVSDIETVAQVFNDGVLVMLGDFLRIIFIVVSMYIINWSLATVVVLILPIMIIVTRVFQKALKSVYQDERTLTARFNTFVQERLSGMNIVQTLNRQQAEQKNFEVINAGLRQNHLKTVWYFSLLFPVVDIVSATAIGLLILVGGYSSIVLGAVSVGQLIAFFFYITQLTQPMRMIAERFNSLQRGLVGAGRVFEILDSDETLPDNGKLKITNIKGAIEFKDVYFSYNPGNPILKGISFTTNPGETIAIVGATGAGKSTIINLLSRFYDIDSGSITIDGINIYDIKMKSLRKLSAVVLQDVFLFNSTILENITLGNGQLTMEEIHQAAKEIGVHDFIMSLPKQYYTEVSERGSTLSVGQRQLISFLRAYLYNPAILVLDEATSSIDTESEHIIQAATRKLTQGRTSIIIAHRLATIQNADKILVMEHGEIVESGTHEELLLNSGYYESLYQVQFK